MVVTREGAKEGQPGAREVSREPGRGSRGEEVRQGRCALESTVEVQRFQNWVSHGGPLPTV